MSNNKISKQILTTKEVADFLNIHPLTVQRMAKGGRIPAFKIGADWRFQRKTLDRWIKEKIEYHTTGKERRRSKQQELI